MYNDIGSNVQPYSVFNFFYLIIDRDIRLNTYLRRKVIET